jgi:hypothetical protein
MVQSASPGWTTTVIVPSGPGVGETQGVRKKSVVAWGVSVTAAAPVGDGVGDTVGDAVAVGMGVSWAKVGLTSVKVKGIMTAIVTITTDATDAARC